MRRKSLGGARSARGTVREGQSMPQSAFRSRWMICSKIVGGARGRVRLSAAVRTGVRALTRLPARLLCLEY